MSINSGMFRVFHLRLGDLRTLKAAQSDDERRSLRHERLNRIKEVFTLRSKKEKMGMHDKAGSISKKKSGVEES